jgi:hypothetical protein
MDPATLVLIILPLIVGGGLMATLLVLTRIMPGEPKPAGKGAQPPQITAAPARGPEYVQRSAGRKAAFRIGWAMLLALAILTVAEIAVSLGLNSVPLLLIVNLIEAGLILYVFMHVKSVWSSEETH